MRWSLVFEIALGVVAGFVALAVMVYGGESNKANHDDWITYCTAHDFSAKQCEVLGVIAHRIAQK